MRGVSFGGGLSQLRIKERNGVGVLMYDLGWVAECSDGESWMCLSLATLLVLDCHDGQHHAAFSSNRHDTNDFQ